ncbi:MAG: hypothetical protein QOG03_821, partial [Actinomycetota bacterium]|nr:hypothetical protein [Actinomycetota bacterium]
RRGLVATDLPELIAVWLSAPDEVREQIRPHTGLIRSQTPGRGGG